MFSESGEYIENTMDDQSTWKVLIVDDEDEVHKLTRMVLEDYTFKGKSISFHSAYSGKESIDILKSIPDFAIIMLDVVMETDSAGLEVVKYIRESLKNNLIQIVLRTGHTQAPPQEIISEYEINSYNSKVELTASKLFTLVTASLRTFDMASSLKRINQDLKNKLDYSKDAENEIQRLNQFQENVIDSADIWLHVLDENFEIVIWNKAAETISGYSKEEVIGNEKIWHFLFPDNNNRSKTVKHFHNAIESKTGLDNFETPIRHKSGQFKTICWNIRIIKDKDGKLNGVTALGRDITEQKILESQFLHAQKMEAIGRLAGGIAHDFNNMLTVIRGYCELLILKMDNKNSKYKRIMHIDKAAEKAENLTNQLLAFSRQQIMKTKVIDLNRLIEDLTSMVDRLVSENISITTQLNNDLGNIKADPGQIEQVIMNLVINARDAMKNGGNIVISTQNVLLNDQYFLKHSDIKEGPYVLLSINDNGCGMSEETKDFIFEPFFTTKEKGKGTGLGLSTVYGIVHQSQGHILVESEVGQGTIFKCFFPRIDYKESIETTFAPIPIKMYGTETILVIEDQKEVLNFANEALALHGYRVFEALTIDSAIEICDEFGDEIDLIVTDIVMPKMNGFEFVDLNTKKYPKTKYIYMSGYNENMLEQDILVKGENFIQKPFSANTLLTIVRQKLDSVF
jgi:PAS domain S-box-containing protein